MFPMPSLLDPSAFRLLLPASNSIADTDGVWGSQAAEARWRFNTDFSKEEYRAGGSGYTPDGDWAIDFAGKNASDFEIAYFDVTGDTGDMTGLATSVTGGTENWYTLSAARYWGIYLYNASSFGVPDSVTVSGTIKLREIAVPANVKTSTLSLTASGEGIA